MKRDLYLPVEVGGIKFKNPFFVASGPTTKSVKQLMRIEETGWAAASIKLTIDPAPYINRVPRYAVFNDRNALCFTAEKRLKLYEGLKLIEDAKKVLKELVLMANITYAGEKGTEGWVNMAKRFEEVGADIIELNMCCPNMSFNVELSNGDEQCCSIRTGASLGQQSDAVAEIVREIKKAIKIPLFVKLTPEGGRIAQVAKSIYTAGADAVGGTGNRLGMPLIDHNDPGKAVYHLQDEVSMSCHSGAWLKPLALRDTYEIRKVNGPKARIMAAGGVRTALDAAEMIMCGADLVGICSETLISGFGFIENVIADLKTYMTEHGYTNLRDMRDILVPLVKSAPELTLYDGYAKITKPNLAAPCKAACPHHVPAQAYVRSVAKGDFKRAYELIMEKNPLQSVCAWVCNHPCEEACVRGELGQPVPIKDIKRFVIEYGQKNGWKPEIKIGKKRSEAVAVIGSGPIGLSCAWHLAQAGYCVTVFEKEKELGGILRYGIPTFRINHAVLDMEIEALKSAGIKFATAMEFGRDITMENLKKRGFSAVFMGMGANSGTCLGIPGEDYEGVFSAVDFLKSVYEKKTSTIGKKVVVIGGGYSAMDAARAARRLGAEEVFLTFRKSREEMKLMDEDMAEAEAEGVRALFLVAPKEIIAEGGKLVGIKLANEILSRRETGGVKHDAVDGAEFMLNCDTVIVACGQNPEQLSEQTEMENVFVGSDMSDSVSIISAITSGKRAACTIDHALAGTEAVLEYEEKQPVVSKQAVLKRTGYFRDTSRISLITSKGSERITGFFSYKRTLTEDEAVKEAERCLNCGCGEGCGLCATLCSEFAIHVKKSDCWEIDHEECVACGMCYNRCPNKNIEMVDRKIIVK